MSLTRDNFQYDLLKTEMQLCQDQVNKYDQVEVSIKTWVVTLWVGSLGFMLELKEPRIAILLVILIFFFWTFDAANRNHREDYKNRRNDIAGVLQKAFITEEFSPDTTVVSFPTHRWQRTLHEGLVFHIALFYTTLIVVSLVMYVLM